MDGLDAIDPEFATVWGPFSIQAEYMRAFVTLTSGGTAELDGVYVFASYFLTGEHRVFSLSEAEFARIRPRQDFLRDDFLGFGEGWGGVGGRGPLLADRFGQRQGIGRDTQRRRRGNQLVSESECAYDLQLYLRRPRIGG